MLGPTALPIQLALASSWPGCALAAAAPEDDPVRDPVAARSEPPTRGRGGRRPGHRALGLREGAIHAEVRLNDEGAWILEVALGRSAGCARGPFDSAPASAWRSLSSATPPASSCRPTTASGPRRASSCSRSGRPGGFARSAVSLPPGRPRHRRPVDHGAARGGARSAARGRPVPRLPVRPGRDARCGGEGPPRCLVHA